MNLSHTRTLDGIAILTVFFKATVVQSVFNVLDVAKYTHGMAHITVKYCYHFPTVLNVSMHIRINVYNSVFMCVCVVCAHAHMPAYAMRRWGPACRSAWDYGF